MKFERNSRFSVPICSVLIGLGAVFLTSCLPLHSARESRSVEGDEARIIKGRIIYKSPDESFSSVFNWKSKGSSYELRLRDRLGLRRLRIEGNSEAANIQTSNGELLENVDLQAWLDEEFGISVPILELPDCIDMDCSVVMSGNNHEYDELNRLVEFSYGAWTVRAVYGTRSDRDSSEVNEIQLLKGKTRLRMVFDN